MNIENIAAAYNDTQRSIKRIKLEIAETEHKATAIEPMIGAWAFDQYIRTHHNCDLFSFTLDCSSFCEVRLADQSLAEIHANLIKHYIRRLPQILLPLDRSDLQALKDYIRITCGEQSVVKSSTHIAPGSDCPRITVSVRDVQNAADSSDEHA